MNTLIAAAEIITKEGGISADYIIDALFIVVAFILVSFAAYVTRNLISAIDEIKNDLVEVKRVQNEHATKIQLHGQLHDRYEETPKYDPTKAADEIIQRMRVMGMVIHEIKKL